MQFVLEIYVLHGEFCDLTMIQMEQESFSQSAEQLHNHQEIHSK